MYSSICTVKPRRVRRQRDGRPAGPARAQDQGGGAALPRPGLYLQVKEADGTVLVAYRHTRHVTIRDVYDDIYVTIRDVYDDIYVTIRDVYDDIYVTIRDVYDDIYVTNRDVYTSPNWVMDHHTVPHAPWGCPSCTTSSPWRVDTGP
jgi:hypothetical protein